MMYIKFGKAILTTLMLLTFSAHSADQKSLSDDQLNALYFFKVASLAVDKCGYQMNTDLFTFIFDEYKLTDDLTDPNGSFTQQTVPVNQLANEFMNKTSCEKLSKLFGIKGEALPGMLIVK